MAKFIYYVPSEYPDEKDTIDAIEIESKEWLAKIVERNLEQKIKNGQNFRHVMIGGEAIWIDEYTMERIYTLEEFWEIILEKQTPN